MGKLAEAYVDIIANLKPLEQGLGRAKAMLTSFAKAGAGLAIGPIGGAGLVGGLVLAAKKAADLGESLSKVRVTFGKDADGMIDQAEQLAKRFGVVKQQALDAASAFGLMGRAAGLSTAASARLGQQFTALGLDLASYHNISNEEAFGKLRSGLAGEAEPLRPLGIMLSEDAVKAEALATGLVKVKRELTDQEKIIARISLIQKQAGAAVGDLARTEDSNANQMRKLEGELVNAATEFGEKLSGALRDGLKLAHEIGDALAGPGQGLGGWLGNLLQGLIHGGRVIASEGIGGLFNGSVEHAAGIQGLPLTAGPAAGPNRAAQRNAILAADAAKRQAFEEQGRKKENDRIMRSGVGLAHKMAGATLAQSMGLGGTTLGAMMGGFGLNDVANIAAGEVERRGEDQANAAMNHAQRRAAALRPREFGVNAPNVAFHSQSFSSGADFAKFAIEQALSDPAKTQENELEELRNMAISLKDLLGLGQGFIQRVDAAPPLRAILRGAS